MTVPGFAAETADGLDLVIADGPARAAGVFSGDASSVLWTRQVVQDGVLRAVALDPGAHDADGTAGPAGFQHVHAVAEQVAERLGIGAIDVAVLPGPAPEQVHREYAGWRLAARATDHAVVLTTDADLTAADLLEALADALDSVPWAERSALVLASGAATARPTVAALATAIADLLDAVPIPTTIPTTIPTPTPTPVPTHESTRHAS